MKKRKLSEKERPALRFSITRPAWTNVLYTWKTLTKRDDPRAVARYIAAELQLFPPYGIRALSRIIEYRWDEKRFVAELLIALGEHLLSGKQMFDDLDKAIAEIIAQDPAAFPSDVIRQLTPRYPILAADDESADKIRTKIKQRVTRLRKIIRPLVVGDKNS